MSTSPTHRAFIGDTVYRLYDDGPAFPWTVFGPTQNVFGLGPKFWTVAQPTTP